MLKKLCALIMAFAMVASLFAVGAAAAEPKDNKLVRGEFRYFIEGEEINPTDKVQAGQTVAGKVKVKNADTESQYATLITALYDSSEKLAAIKSQRQWIGKNKCLDFEVTVTAPSEDENAKYDVKSFVWVTLSSVMPCKDVMTSAPAIPTDVTVIKSENGNVIAWSAVSADEIDVYGYNVYRDGSYIATVTAPEYTDAAIAEAVYTVTAFGLNESAMSQPAQEVKEPEYITATLDMSEVYDTFNAATTLEQKTHSFSGGLNLYVNATAAGAYDKDFATNKTSGTFGFVTKTDSAGVEKKCLGSNDLPGERIMINIPAGDVLSSAAKKVTLTILDNKSGTYMMRYSPSSGNRKDITFNLTGSGKWITLSAELTDTYTSTSGKNYHFELGRGSNKYGEIYIADISISAPKEASAE